MKINKSYSLFAILNIFFFLSSCEQDNEVKTSNGFSFKVLNFNQAIRINEFKNSFSSFQEDLKNFKNKSHSKTSESTTDFEIDSTTINEIKVDDIITYTMLVKNKSNTDSNSFENLILKTDTQGNTKAYILKYLPEGEMTYVPEHDSYTFKGTKELREINFNIKTYAKSTINNNDLPEKESGECTTVLMCNQGGHEHLAGNCTPGYQYWVIDCRNAGGGGSIGIGSGSTSGGSTSGGSTSGGSTSGGSTNWGGSSGGSGSTSNNTGSTNTTTPINGEIPTATVVPYKNLDVATLLSLTAEQKKWLSNIKQLQIKKELQQYLYYNNTAENYEFARQLLNLAINKNIPWEKITNWYSLTKPGVESDESDNNSFWDDPNLTFPQQNLPEYLDFKNNFPDKSITSKMLCTNIGGEVLDLYNKIIANGKEMNTCAIRLSYALNHSGIEIPNVPGTKLGKDGKYYFPRAIELNKWMLKTFGSNSNVGLGPTNNNHKRYYSAHLTEYLDPKNSNILNPNNPLNGIQGIFSMVSSNPDWSTGHCDILQSDTTCINNCHFEGPIKYIDIWILP